MLFQIRSQTNITHFNQDTHMRDNETFNFETFNYETFKAAA